jgi:transcriptional regulator NrdR family protein
MKCPECNGPTLVDQVRAENGRRRRKCRKCQHEFHTEEVIVPAHEHGGDRHSDEFKARQGRH